MDISKGPRSDLRILLLLLLKKAHDRASDEPNARVCGRQGKIQSVIRHAPLGCSPVLVRSGWPSLSARESRVGGCPRCRQRPRRQLKLALPEQRPHPKTTRTNRPRTSIKHCEIQRIKPVSMCVSGLDGTDCCFASQSSAGYVSMVVSVAFWAIVTLIKRGRRLRWHQKQRELLCGAGRMGC